MGPRENGGGNDIVPGNPFEEDWQRIVPAMRMEIRGSIGACSIPAVKASPESLTVAEGGSVDYEVVLTTLPDGRCDGNDRGHERDGAERKSRQPDVFGQ